MKGNRGLNVILGATLTSLSLTAMSFACDNVFVKTVNGAGDMAAVGITMNTSTPLQTAMTLDASGSRIDDLAVSANSPQMLTLSATVKVGSMEAQCSTTVANENLNGQCLGVVDPKLVLTITATDGTPPSTSTDTVKGGKCCGGHDCGNHIGEDRHKAGLIVGVDVPYHYGKLPQLTKGGKMMHHGRGMGSTSVMTTTPGTAPTLSCSFATASSF